MRNMKAKKLCVLAGVALLFMACGEDDRAYDAVKLNASIQPLQAGQPSTRVLPYDSWSALADRRIAVSVDGIIKEYQIDEHGVMAADAPFYWEGRTSLKVDAWYPYNEGVKSAAVLVKADQSNISDYLASDCVEVTGASVTPEKTTLTFLHRTAKLTCKVTSENPEELSTELSSVKFSGLTGVEGDGNTVTMTEGYNALVAPQTLAAGISGVRVQLKDKRSYYATLQEDLILEAGRSYMLKLAVNKDGIATLKFIGSSAWDDKESSEIEGSTPGVTPGEGNSAWGDKENGGEIMGETPVVEPGKGEGSGSWGTSDKSDLQGELGI